MDMYTKSIMPSIREDLMNRRRLRRELARDWSLSFFLQWYSPLVILSGVEEGEVGTLVDSIPTNLSRLFSAYRDGNDLAFYFNLETPTIAVGKLLADCRDGSADDGFDYSACSEILTGVVQQMTRWIRRDAPKFASKKLVDAGFLDRKSKRGR